MVVGLLVSLIVKALAGIIILGSIFATIHEISRPNWTRAPWVRLLIILAAGLCAPVKRLMVGVGIPTRPIDFSPAITIVGLEIVGRVLNLIF